MIKSTPPIAGLIDYSTIEQYRHLDESVSSYQLQELHVRELLHERLKADRYITTVLFTDPISDQFAPYDALICSGETWYLLEAKERSYALNAWREWFIEQEKIKSVNEVATSTGTVPAWCTLTTDNHCLIWTDTGAHTRCGTQYVVKSTIEQEKGKRDKSFFYYSTSTATII